MVDMFTKLEMKGNLNKNNLLVFCKPFSWPFGNKATSTIGYEETHKLLSRQKVYALKSLVTCAKVCV